MTNRAGSMLIAAFFVCSSMTAVKGQVQLPEKTMPLVPSKSMPSALGPNYLQSFAGQAMQGPDSLAQRRSSYRVSSIRFGGRPFATGGDNGKISLPTDHPAPGQPPVPAEEIIGWAYGPSIMNTTSPSGTPPRYFMYFCMADYHRGGMASDQMGFSWSYDGVQWSSPQVILHVTSQKEGGTCDPSIVHFDGSGRVDVDGYYYLFYSGNLHTGYQTVMFVARSKSPFGPFEKFSGRNNQGQPTWGGDDPAVIIAPIKLPVPDNYYGAGEQSVLVHTYPDGVMKFLSRYSDDSANTTPIPTNENRSIYFRTSLNAIDWSAPVRTNVIATSVDVKLEESTGLFHMFYIAPLELNVGTFLAHRVSSDGVSWGSEEQLCVPFYAFPSCAHNVGVSGNPNGHLLDTLLVGYGGPGFGYGKPGFDNIEQIFTTNGNSSQPWDLYFHVINDSKRFQRGYFEFVKGGPVGQFFSDGQNWWAFVTKQDSIDHHNQNPRQPDNPLGSVKHTDIGTFKGPWHSGMPISP